MADTSHGSRGGRSSRSRGSSRSSARPSRARFGSQRSARATSAASRGFAGASTPDSNRVFVPILLFAAIAALFLLRLVYVQVIMAPTYGEMAEQARTVSFPVEARRGTIYDRNGTVLATSVDATTIYANPTEVENASEAAQAIASVLGGSSKDYLQALTADATNYSIIKRKVDVSVGQKVKDLKLDGVYFVTESKREYPNGRVGGQVIGACSIAIDEDTNSEYYTGISGLELYYNDVLTGQAGYYEAERGSDGTPIPGGVHESKAAVDGQDIIVSIDIELQQYVEDRLEAGVEQMSGKGGSAVVMDGGTGEIYAAASMPLFNPADRSEVKEDATRLKCVTDLFEPGSIFKSVSAMAVLETGTMKPDTELFCPASITADGYTISDAHERGDATFTLQQIMDQSSNVGISLATEKMGFQQLYDHILTYNLHSKTGVDYPGEGGADTNVMGYLLDFEDWSAVQAYNISFGQGISVTPLQMTRFYGALVNNGVECTPHFLLSKPQSGDTPEWETEDVVQNKSAIADMTSMLKTVVTDGTGKLAAIDGFNVAGKTSTAEIYDPENGGYLKDVYNMAFTGFLADSSSQLVCFVGANEVGYEHVVTPIFKDIMTTAIDRFNIRPE